MVVKNKIWLSILIPAYNVESYVKECVDSILRQYCDGIEIIVLNDHSTDQTLQIIEQLSAESPGKIRVLQSDAPRNGLAAARNFLVAHATGDYIWFIDSDDKIVDGAIDSLKKIVNDDAPDYIMCDYFRWRDVYTKKQIEKDMHVTTFDGVAWKVINEVSDLIEGIFRAGQLFLWTKIHKRSLWAGGVRCVEGKNFEDIGTAPILALNARNFYYIPIALVAYRQRQGSIINNFSMKSVFDIMGAFLNFRDYLSRCDLEISRAAWQAYLYSVSEHLRRCVKDMRKIKEVPPGMPQYQELLRMYADAVDGKYWEVAGAYRQYGKMMKWVDLMRWRLFANGKGRYW